MIVKSYDDFVNYITLEGVPSAVSFDYYLANEKTKTYSEIDQEYEDAMNQFAVESCELGFHEAMTVDDKTGFDCAKWLTNYCIKNQIPMPNCVVHCWNERNKRTIQEYLDSYEDRFASYYGHFY